MILCVSKSLKVGCTSVSKVCVAIKIGESAIWERNVVFLRYHETDMFIKVIVSTVITFTFFFYLSINNHTYYGVNKNKKKIRKNSTSGNNKSEAKKQHFSTGVVLFCFVSV